MSYASNDVAPASGIPMEFYRFVGLLRNYLYCDQPNAVVLNGETYEPLTLFRDNIEVGSVLDAQKAMSVSVPANCDLAKDYGGQRTPTQLRLVVFRAYKGDNLATQFKRRFQGRATAYSYQDRLFQIQFNNVIGTDLSQENRQVYFQALCNHKLYDARCKANKAANTTLSTVVNFSDAAVEVADDGWPNGDLRVGTLVNVRTGEERLIFDNLANVLNIGYPFIDIQIGDQVQMIRGCNHGTSDCILKFDNYDNYGGFLFMPDVNPFNNEV